MAAGPERTAHGGSYSEALVSQLVGALRVTYLTSILQKNKKAFELLGGTLDKPFFGMRP